MPVRDKLPIRRPSPSKNPSGDNWRIHKPDLKEDFNDCCGYCGSYDGYKHTYFEVDHFIPKHFLKDSGSAISLCDYKNLVYSCKFCNNKKLNKWPSKSETEYISNNKGFVDPCSSDYENQFRRTKDGSIIGVTEVGKWMATEAFKFDERDFAIKLLWELKRSKTLIFTLISELKKADKGGELYNQIEEEAKKLSLKYFVNHNELIEYYNSL